MSSSLKGTEVHHHHRHHHHHHHHTQAVDIDGVVVYFPLPAEDPLARRRQLRAAANAIHQGVLQQRSTAFGDRRRREIAATRTPWQRDGTTVVSRKAETVHRDLVKHVLVALETKDRKHLKKKTKREPFAFAVVPLPNLDAARQASESFAVPLSLCGRHRGVLRGRVTFKRIVRRGTALKSFQVTPNKQVNGAGVDKNRDGRPDLKRGGSTFFSFLRSRTSPTSNAHKTAFDTKIQARPRSADVSTVIHHENNKQQQDHLVLSPDDDLTSDIDDGEDHHHEPSSSSRYSI